MTTAVASRSSLIVDAVAARAYAFDRFPMAVSNLFSRLFFEGAVDAVRPGKSPAAQVTQWALGQLVSATPSLADAAVEVTDRPVERRSFRSRPAGVPLRVTLCGADGSLVGCDIDAVRCGDGDLRLPRLDFDGGGTRAEWETFASDLDALLARLA